MHPKRIRSYLLELCTAAALLVTLSLTGTFYVFSDEWVSISASVWVSNNPPFVASVSPSTSPSLVEKNSYQTFSIMISDPDSPSILYTVSTASGVVMPTSGTIPVSGGTAQVNFTYFAPSYKARLVPIYVTLDDQSWNPPLVKQVDVYVY